MRNSNIKLIVIHCSASPHRGDTAADVHEWHLERGWSGIGYHYTIDEFGKLERGRPEYWIGAHVKGHNTGSLGIMLFGESYFSPAQQAQLLILLRDLKERYPDAKIRGHRDLTSHKTCPNFDVRQWCKNRGIEHG